MFTSSVVGWPLLTRQGGIARSLGALVLVLTLVVSGIRSAPQTFATQQAHPLTGTAVHMWLTQGSSVADAARLTRQPDVTFVAAMQDETPADTPIIEVYPDLTAQTIIGFGAAMTDSSAWNIARLNPQRRTELMQALFDPDIGIGLSFIRQPLGASDYVAATNQGNPFYTYQDSYGAPVAVTRDQRSLDLVKQAKTFNPALTVMASPWSPPAWMRFGSSLIGADRSNVLLQGNTAAYAQYLADSVAAYRDQGVNVDYLSVQNEPLHNPGYLGLVLPASPRAATAMGLTNSANQIGVVRELSSALTERQLATQILVYDHNWDIPSQNWDDSSWTDPTSANPAYPVEVLDDASTGTRIADLPNVAGTALHCYEGLAGNARRPANSTLLHDRFEDSIIVMTECSGTETFDSQGMSSTFSDTMRYHATNYLFSTLRHWSQSYVLWNLALDPDSGPYPKGYGICENCSAVMTVDNQNDPQFTKNVGYYMLGHLSSFVQPGAVRLESDDIESQQVYNVAFRNTDGSYAVVLYRDGTVDSVQDVVVRLKDDEVSVPLSGNSMATLTWQPPGSDGGGDDPGGDSDGGGTSTPGKDTSTPKQGGSSAKPKTTKRAITVRKKAVITRVAYPKKRVGKTKVGARLKVRAGKTRPVRTVATYQWLRGKKKIKGATGARYRIKARDSATRIRVKVTIRAPGYRTTSYLTKAVRVKR